MKNFLKNLWNDDRGQSTTEYILILAVVLIVAMQFKKKFQATMTKMTDKLDSDMNGAMTE